MAHQRPEGQECPSCHLINPAASRRCVCGRDLVSKWQRHDEQEAKQLHDGQMTSIILRVVSTAIFLGVLFLAYQYSGSL